MKTVAFIPFAVAANPYRAKTFYLLMGSPYSIGQPKQRKIAQKFQRLSSQPIAKKLPTQPIA